MEPSFMSKKNQAFTLIEMSMVLISIALLIGAILIGQSLIRNARVLSISADIEVYKNATTSFLNKYKYLPGDMPTATNFWGEDISCPTTPENEIPKMATCNGNGDSYIGDSNGTAYGNANNWYESLRYWQHLTNSGFITGYYNGAISSRTTKGIDPGMNIPKSQILGNGYYMLHVQPGLDIGLYNSNYHHVYIFGAPVTPKASTYGAALPPAEARMVDQKVDDGKPGSGFVLSFTEESEEHTDCVTNKSEIGAQYNIEQDDISCSLIFITGM
jgi:type II secretory pathway pseudopilin PulG